MRIGVAPASTRTCAAAIRSLLEQSSNSSSSIEVRAWYRDIAKAPSEFLSHANFEAVKGDVSDASSFDFEGCDVIITVPPPFFKHENMVELSENLSRNIKTAIEKSTTVKRLVMMSSMGAHLYDGVGEIKTKTAAERILVETRIPRITVIRPAYFMENWAAQYPTLKAPEPSVFSYLTPSDWKLEMVSIKDVGKLAAKEATADAPQSTPVYICEIQGPQKEGYSSLEVRDVLTKILGKEVNLQLIEKSKLPDFFGAFLPSGCVNEFVEMASSFLQGGALNVNPDPQANVVHGDTSLESALEEAIREQEKISGNSA
ncbi:unnamed protein product [Clonostachys rosea]|uniref:NmrA-like domain-containing protein n=1 Tax=Bionectria ochroleuca TaxID=29856 RepID=A0ABY6TRG0_BIOOC|nr:unnamed protein product [Clonostachys rosea]